MIQVQNKEEYQGIPISRLGFSTRTFNCLMRAQFDTLYLLIENIGVLPGIRNMGVKSLTEIENFLNSLDELGIDQLVQPEKSKKDTDPAVPGLELPEDILSRPAGDLFVSLRIKNVFAHEGIKTIGQVITLSMADMANMRNMGALSISELCDQITLLNDLGEAYFDAHENDDELTQSNNSGDRPAGKGFDYSVIDILTEHFSFKSACMSEWFGISRQRVYDLIKKRSYRRADNWTGKELTEREESILVSLIENQSYDYKDDSVICSCLNNRQNDFACVFVYEDEIKCFFLNDLPEKLQIALKASNFHRYSERELAGESAGDIVCILRKPYFFPKESARFRENARLRGLSADEYAEFISGCPLGDSRSVTDDQIIAFMEENMIDGKVYISSDPRNQWIRSLASRNGYTILDFIKLYGYESRMEGSELTPEKAQERHIEELKKCIVYDNVVYVPTYSNVARVLTTYCYKRGIKINDYIESLGFKRTNEKPKPEQDILEQDMQVRHSDASFEEKIYARYPLLGSKILSSEIADKLNQTSKKYIDTVLRNPMIKLPIRAEMQITLALINNAKNWKSEENRDFWNYISLQFGYRDSSGAVVRLLQKCMENAIKKNRRLFIEDANGRAFKSTAVIHALSTRKSWMALFDFLFDFYKNNLNWDYIPDDPLYSVMISALQQKLGDDNADEVELTISSRVYSFQEGIRKLILFRPVYSRHLFEGLIRKIDSLVNAEEMPIKTYEEQLCEDWFRDKITAIANSRKAVRHTLTGGREVAIDYSRIRAKIVLRNGNDVQLVLPDIRLKDKHSSGTKLYVYYGNTLVHQKTLSWYGNEFGRTLNGISISLPEFPSRVSDMDIRVKIDCEEETIYDSGETLYHKVLAFYGGSEISIGQIKADNYTLIIPMYSELKVENAEVIDIDDLKNSGLKACFLELHDGFIITVDGKLIAFDSGGGTDIRVIPPSESVKLPAVRIGNTEHYFAYYGSSCSIILSDEDLIRQYILLVNEERIDFSDLNRVENEKGVAFTCPIEDDDCRIRIISLTDERLMFDRSFILAHKASGSFNREFYYSASDYKNAEYMITIDDFTETAYFGQEDEEVIIPYRDGEIHVSIPKIMIEETTGQWMNGKAPAWYLGEIPQNSLLKVSNPSGTAVRFLVGTNDIMYDGRGLVSIGNLLQSIAGTDTCSMADLVMHVSGSCQNDHYQLARISFKEQFLHAPQFWTEDHKLFWDHGGAFIGKADREFELELSGGSEAEYEFSLDNDTDYLSIPDEMPIGNYHYEISILSGGMFRKTKEKIAEGDCVVGDQNALRFMNRRIVIEAITDEFKEEAGHIVIRPCCIDHIMFQGMEDTSEGYCPVYSGIMYTTGYHGERYEFSFDEHTNSRGVTKMMVNPVRIVFVGDNSLCITDSEGDGLYYYYYYDRDFECTVYALTDHEYTKMNKHKYSNADLYSYRTERI